MYFVKKGKPKFIDPRLTHLVCPEDIGYYVLVDVRINGCIPTLPVCFATWTDAERAINGLRNSGLTTFQSLKAQFDKDEYKTIIRIMIESLAW